MNYKAKCCIISGGLCIVPILDLSDNSTSNFLPLSSTFIWLTLIWAQFLCFILKVLAIGLSSFY